jgi:hypothetical protein
VTRTIALAALAASVAVSGALASTAQAPHLRLASAAPLTVVGTGFVSHEVVQVVYHADQTWTRRVTATPAGAFTVRFGGVGFQACKLHRLSAIGSMGSKAYFKMPAVPCPPPPSEP